MGADSYKPVTHEKINVEVNAHYYDHAFILLGLEVQRPKLNGGRFLPMSFPFPKNLLYSKIEY